MPLLDCKKKTYSQDAFIIDLFSAYFDSRDYEPDEPEDRTNFSRWRNGSRPVPAIIAEIYAKPDGISLMAESFNDKILPNILNTQLARQRTEELIKNSIPLIGNEKAEELLSPSDASLFFTGVILYSILSDHRDLKRKSPDLSDYLLNNRIPKPVGRFTGRDEELKQCSEKLNNDSPLFICGVAGIGKSEFAKMYAVKHKKQYSNIVYLFYTGSLKRTIAQLQFIDDQSEDTEEQLFDKHYEVLHRCQEDTLIILDNFDVYPNDDGFFDEFSHNAFHLIVTTRCHLPNRNVLTLAELDVKVSLIPLFYNLCPSVRLSDTDEEQSIQPVIEEIIVTVHCHTLTVTLAALTLSASGITPEDLLAELKSCTLSPASAEMVELSKDNEYSDGLMQEHLRRLLKLSGLQESERYMLMNMSLLPESGVSKVSLKAWLRLPNLSDAVKLVRYGFMQDDEENLKFSLHPLIRDIVAMDTQPSVTGCRTLFDSLHFTTLVQGLEFENPQEILQSLISITERIIDDDPPAYLLFLQDAFTFYDKHLVYDEMGKLIDRIDHVMKENKIDNLCDTALLLDYKGQMCIIRKEYPASAKRRERAIRMVERIPDEEMNQRSISLLSNLYNNLGNVWLMSGDNNAAKECLEKAMQIRIDHDLTESHDTVEQLINITNMHINDNNPDAALKIINLCESVIKDNTSDTSLDYGICEMLRGRICLSMGDGKSAVKSLKQAEGIIENAIGLMNEYMKAVYIYLVAAYALIHDEAQAHEYQVKYKKLKRNLQLSDHSKITDSAEQM